MLHQIHFINMSTKLSSKILIIIFTIWLSHNSNSQSISINDLIKTSYFEDISTFNDFVSSKGFCYNDTQKDDDDFLYSFTKCNKELEDESIMYSNPKNINHNKSSIYSTTSLKLYKNLLLQIKSKGFKGKGVDGMLNNAMTVLYSSSEYPKMHILVSIKSLGGNGDPKYNYYLFNCLRSRKKDINNEK